MTAARRGSAAHDTTTAPGGSEPLLAEGPRSRTVEIGGHRLRLSNLDKVLYPQTGTTKRDVINYYWRIAPRLVAQAHDRPVTRKRWVDGVGTANRPGEPFFQKNLGRGTPQWVPRVRIEYVRKTDEQPLANEPAVLVWLAQTATLEIHTPSGGRSAPGGATAPTASCSTSTPGRGRGWPTAPGWRSGSARRSPTPG